MFDVNRVGEYKKEIVNETKAGLKTSRTVSVEIQDGGRLEGNLDIPRDAKGIVVFAHGSGSSRFSPRNRFVAETLRSVGLGTLLFDLLTREEEATDLRTGQLRFDLTFLANRLLQVTHWLKDQPEAHDLKLGYFGSSTGGGAALVAVAKEPDVAVTVVSRGGRPDLAGAALPKVKAPTLLIVGGNDHPVIKMNQEAMERMRQAEVKLEIVADATHLFEEPGTLEQVAELASQWFKERLREN